MNSSSRPSPTSGDDDIDGEANETRLPRTPDGQFHHVPAAVLAHINDIRLAHGMDKKWASYRVTPMPGYAGSNLATFHSYCTSPAALCAAQGD